MDYQLLSAVAGIALSLGFSYIPGVKGAFGALTGDWKRVVMLIMLAVVAGAVYGLSCGEIINTVTCDQAGAMVMVEAFVLALIANQSAYTITPKRS
jgi:hypothetical protein